ncbi:LLM class flavin-dependent oxidoreductase [Micromonospora sp. NPDC049559]|uniref:LLM class flavin-dependent oxidoreductase n=1 Tax=Micromonospora sp. NPDC049559 TaxID=3155923 RepID=UPI00341B1EED
MKIGIGIPNQVPNLDPTVIPPWARRAEQAGFSTLGTVGRIAYPGVQDTVALAAAAGATSTIGLFTNVLLGPTWPPVLLAKELAGIDGVSGGRFTLGIGLGGRPDDFTVEGRGPKGKIMDADLKVYRDVWAGGHIKGALTEGGRNAGVPAGTRQIPILFGGVVPAAFARMAKQGEGYIGTSLPVTTVSKLFDSARDAWTAAGRKGAPRLVAITYFALGDGEKGRANVYDYYSTAGEDFAKLVAGYVSVSADDVRDRVKAFESIGADEIIFNSATDNLDDIERLAEIVL